MYPKIDFIIGLAIMVFAAVGRYMAGLLPPAKKGLGPGDYPKVILTIIFFLGMILAGNAFYQYRKKLGSKKKNFEKGEFKQVLLLAGTTALYIKIQFYFGYLFLTPVFMFVMMYLFGLRKWIKMAAISVVTGAATYIIFNNYLYVLLPRFNLF